MLKRVKVLMFLMLALFIAPISYGIGVGLYTTEADFEPNFNANYMGLVTNNVGQDIIVELRVKGDLTEYVTFGQEYMEIPKGQVATFTFNIKLPERIKPGLNIIDIGAEDITPPSEGGITAKTAAFFPFKIRMPYPGKYIEAKFSAGSIEKDGIATFDIDIVSRGNETIKSIGGIIEIFDDENKIDVLNIGTISDINPGERRAIKTEWSSKGEPVGEYKAKARIDYDGEEIELDTTFRIGTFSVEIINYTTEFYKDEINKFDIEIESLWNKGIDGVYGEIKVGDQRIETLKINLGAWSKAKVTAYLDTTNLDLGDHTADMKVYYGDKIAEETGKITVLAKREVEMPSNKISPAVILMIGVIALLVAGNALLVIYFMKQRRVSKLGKKRK